MLYVKILNLASKILMLLKKITHFFQNNILLNKTLSNQNSLKKYNFEHKLVKSRPTIDSLFEPVKNNEEIDVLFFRVKNVLFEQYSSQKSKMINFRTPVKRVLKEIGKTTNGTPYFYLQPLNKEGLLFEKNAEGWNVYIASKIPNNNTFLRKYEPWDVVKLYKNKEGLGFPRVKSQRFGQDLMSFIIYEQKLLDSLNNYLKAHE